MDLNDYIGPFIDETQENLQSLNEFLLSFEGGNQDVINDIFRVAHTLKGMAATMGFHNMSSLTHLMEDVLDEVRSNRLHLRREEDISMLFECLDTLNLFLESIRDGRGDQNVDTSGIKENLKKVLEAGDERQNAPSGKTQPPETGDNVHDPDTRKVHVCLDDNCMLKGARAFMILEEVSSIGHVVSTSPPMEKIIDGTFDDSEFVMYLSSATPDEVVKKTVLEVSEVKDCRIAEAKDSKSEEIPDDNCKPAEEKSQPGNGRKASDMAGSFKNRTSQTVRVDVNKLDKLLNLVGELVIGRSRIERLARESDFREFEEPILQLGRISKEIQELVTKLRMLPISFIFDRFPRLVRDLSHSLEKKVSLEVEGRDTELDRTVIDEIGDPMVHLIRNSLDHGLESPEERLKSGKKETGLLRVRAYQDGSSVVVAVEDDGKGIDKTKILAQAVRKGLITEDQAGKTSDMEAFQFLFVPGLSTSDEVSDISGRGVGMDAVKNKVESLGGRITVESEKGKGTRVKVKLPITLAIVLALLVKIDSTIYAVPLESVDETIKVSREDVKVVNGGLVTMLRGEILNLVDSRKFYGLEEREKDSDLPVVVMRTGFQRIGFVVDDFVGQQEIVIKTLNNRGKVNIDWFSGGTILGDGSVALIIDPSAVE